VEDSYHTTSTPVSLNFGAGMSYAAGTNTSGAGHNDYLDLGLDTTADILLQLEDAPDTTYPSQGGRPQQAPDRFMPGSHTVQRKHGRCH
jgi:hypothetical protein